MSEGQPALREGLALLQVGRAEEAVQALWRAATQDPGSFEVRFHLGRALAQTGRHADAIRELQAALQIDPGSAEAQRELGIARQLAAQPARPPAYGTPAQRRRTGGLSAGAIVAIVVVGLIVVFGGVIAAIVFPAFGKAQEKARQTTCLSNVKQLNLGMLMYAQDHAVREQMQLAAGVFPPSGAWADGIEPYVRNPALLQCPGAPELEYGYAMNSAVGGAGIMSLGNPATTELLYDSTANSKNANDALTSLPSPGRHYGFNNIGYVDGHAKSVKGAPTAP